jgi:Flp pilus assembly protein TadD
MDTTRSTAAQDNLTDQPLPDVARRLSDGQANTIYAAAYQLSEQGRHDQAVSLFALLALYRPKEPKYALATAISFRRMRRYEEAIVLFGQTMALQPHNWGPAFQMVECMMLLGRRAEALNVLATIKHDSEQAGQKDAVERAGALLELIEQGESKCANPTSP